MLCLEVHATPCSQATFGGAFTLCPPRRQRHLTAGAMEGSTAYAPPPVAPPPTLEACQLLIVVQCLLASTTLLARLAALRDTMKGAASVVD